jgi:FkbM family methyltransferase
LCVEHGANRVISVEAQPVIYQGLVANTRYFKAVTLHNLAAYHVDGDVVHIDNQHVASRIGGTTGDKVTTTTLVSLLVLENVIGNNLVLKLDCEGAEFNVVLTSPVEVIRRFSVVYMEVHNNTNPNPEWQDSNMLGNKMLECGFQQVKRYAIQGLNENRETFDLGVYVDKWVRV